MTASAIGQREWDAVVIGAGPAGSLAAERLARRGHSVLLVDKALRGRPKVCGGCLGSIGLAALDEARLPLAKLGVDSMPLHRVSIHSGGRQVSLPLSRRVAISRQVFDERLLTAAEHAGVHLATSYTARVESIDGDRRTVRLEGAGDQPLFVRAKLVLIAGGLGSHNLLPIAERPKVIAQRTSRLGAGITLPAGSSGDDNTVRMVCGRSQSGYVGLAKLPDGSLDVAAALSPAALPSGGDRLAQLAGEILRDNQIEIPPGWFEASWRSTPSLTQRPSTLGAERVLLIGDAAGYVEPFTGEGIGWALRSALAVEPLADAAIHDWRGRFVEDWNQQHAAAIGRWQRRCRIVCGLIGAQRPTSTLVRALSIAPWIARPVLHLIDPPQQPQAA